MGIRGKKVIFLPPALKIFKNVSEVKISTVFSPIIPWYFEVQILDKKNFFEDFHKKPPRKKKLKFSWG